MERGTPKRRICSSQSSPSSGFRFCTRIPHWMSCLPSHAAALSALHDVLEPHFHQHRSVCGVIRVLFFECFWRFWRFWRFWLVCLEGRRTTPELCGEASLPWWRAILECTQFEVFVSALANVSTFPLLGEIVWG